MHNLLVKYSRKVNFLVVYIAEAHAVDEWPVGDPLKIMQPKTNVERAAIAKKFKESYSFMLPMLADTVENDFEQTYSAWPIRFYVVQDKKILFKAFPDEHNTYDSIPPALDQLFSTF